jgi:hypothetical protein
MFLGLPVFEQWLNVLLLFVVLAAPRIAHFGIFSCFFVFSSSFLLFSRADDHGHLSPMCHLYLPNTPGYDNLIEIVGSLAKRTPRQFAKTSKFSLGGGALSSHTGA